ncbi:hypothetical protein [Phycicoccus avicenniae]|uniref:hypothetical protein n=1 Tax=Phycicoccus avicenniae TaxID=2828860 RepID=UPI003D2691C9
MLALAAAIGLCAPTIALASAQARPAPTVSSAAAAASPAYTTSVRTGVGLLGGTTDTGNHCGSYDDWNNTSPCTTPLQFPFPVKFYGKTYTSALADTAGNIQFGGDATRTESDTCFPDPELGPAFAVHTGYAMQTAEKPTFGIFTGVHGTAPHRTFVVEWRAGLAGLSFDDPYAEWDFEARFVEGSSTVSAVFGDSYENDLGPNDTWVRTSPAPWRGSTAVQDGLGHSSGGCGGTPAKGTEVTFTTTPTAPTVVEENGAAVRYSGTWRAGRCGSSTCSPGNRQTSTSAAGARATLTYTGTRADWVASTGPNGGKVGLYVDGRFVRTVDLYSPTIVDGRVFAGPTKASGKHTLTLKRLSGRLNVDAFRVR